MRDADQVGDDRRGATAERALADALAGIERRDAEIAELRRRLAEAGIGGSPRAGGPRGGEAGDWQERRASAPGTDEARLRAVADVVPHLVWTSGPTGRWTWANRRWTEHTGQPMPASRGLGWLEAVHPDDRDATMAAWRVADATGELRVEHRLRGVDGRHRWFATRSLRYREAGGEVSWCGTSTDVEDARRTEEALRDSDAQFRSFAEASPAVLWIVGEGGALEYLSPAYERVWGEPCEAVLRDLGRWADRLHPDDRETALCGLPRVLRGERVVAEYRIRRGVDGAVRWIRDVAFPVRDAEGRVRRAAGLAQDVTEQREAEQRQRLLLHELNHRVKNALAGVQALAAQTARGHDERRTSDALFQAFEERLFALARAHDLLTREAWQGASLSDLVRGTLAPHHDGADPARIAASGPEVRLVPGAAVALHMAFHELATNAAKHGALSAREGWVEVEWSVARSAAGSGPDGGGALEVRWRERGGPPVPGPPARRGFGSRLIERGLSRQLGGEARLDFLPDGVECSFRLPLSARVEAGR